MIRLILLTAYFLICLIGIISIVNADELTDAQKDLAAVSEELDKERYRYNAAKSEMDRADLVARYLFPELQARQKVLKEKIDKLKEQAEKAKAEKAKEEKK